MLAAALGAWAKIELAWHAPPECPDSTNVVARVDRYMDHLGGERIQVLAEAQVEEVEGGWALDLVIRTPDGQRSTRRLVHEVCDGLAESTALLLAIAAAPTPDEGANEPEAEPEPSGDTSNVSELPADEDPKPGEDLVAEPRTTSKPVLEELTTTKTVDEPSPVRTPASPLELDRPRAPPRLRLRALGGVSMGTLPVGGELELAFTVAWARAQLEAIGHYTPRREVRFDDEPEAGADVSSWGAGARICNRFRVFAWFELPFCIGAEAGQMLGRAVGLDPPGRDAAPWFALLTSGTTRFRVHRRLAFSLTGELVTMLLRPVFLAGEEEVYRAGLVGGRVLVGAEFEIW